MRSLRAKNKERVGLAAVVALFQLALVTWVPLADAVHHGGSHPISAGESGETQGDGSRLASVCFVCAAGLGAFAPHSPAPVPGPSYHWRVPAETVPDFLPASLQVTTTLPRGPPNA